MDTPRGPRNIGGGMCDSFNDQFIRAKGGNMYPSVDVFNIVNSIQPIQQETRKKTLTLILKKLVLGLKNF